MKRSYITAAFLFAIAGTASAMSAVKVTAPLESANSGEAYQGYVGFVSTKTRAQVIQELRDAKKRGEIYDGESYPGPISAPSSKSRAVVLAELAADRAAHGNVADDGAAIR